MDQPFTIEVYDKAFVREGWVGDPVALTVSLRHNAQPTASLTVRSDHRRIVDLVKPGCRLVIRYLGEVVMSGRIRLRQGQGPASSGTVTFQVVDDWRLLTRVLGWPNPLGTLAQQGDTGRYDTRTGTAEAVVRGFVGRNAIDRLGLPVTLGPFGDRGSVVTVSSRFHPLADRLLPVIDEAGIGVTVRQSGAGWVVDCYEPVLFPRTLTEASGVVQEWSWSRADPDATRIIAGASGEGEARSFRSRVHGSRETEWGDLIEGFRDARDIDTADVGWEAALDARADEALAEAAPTAGLSLKLAETRNFRYDPTGVSGVRVGDKVKVEVGKVSTETGPEPLIVNEVLREAHLSWTATDGLNVSPVVGERTDDPDLYVARAVAYLARTLRDAVRR